MFEITDDYFAAEKLLLEHLKDVEGIKRVYEAREISELPEKSQVTPSLHVTYSHDDLDSAKNGGMYMKFEQFWFVVLAVKSTEKNTGNILTKVINKLAGKVTDGMGPWVRINSRAKPFFNDGFNYYPLAFKCEVRMNTTL